MVLPSCHRLPRIPGRRALAREPLLNRAAARARGGSVMKRRLRAVICAIAAAACFSAAACGPLRLDGRASIRGTVVAVQQDAIAIKHKTGRTYRVELSRDTRIVHTNGSGEVTLCPGVRATAYLTESRTLKASEVKVSGDRCR